MPLPLRLHSDTRQRLASRMYPYLTTVEHLNTSNIKMLARASADNFCEAGDTDAHQFALCTLLKLLAAQPFVVYVLHCQPQCTLVVTAIECPVERGTIGESLWLNEVLQTQLCWVFAQIMGKSIHDALDQVRCFRDAERATIGNTAGRLVGMHRVYIYKGMFEIIRTGADVEQPCWKLRRLRGGIKRAVVSQRMYTQSLDFAILIDRKSVV